MRWLSSLIGRKQEREREEALSCARMVWPTATMGDDGVIRVNMAAEDKWRAENPASEAIRKEMFATSFKGD